MPESITHRMQIPEHLGEHDRVLPRMTLLGRVRPTATPGLHIRAAVRELAVVVDGPHTTGRWYWRDELEAMALSAQRMGYPRGDRPALGRGGCSASTSPSSPATSTAATGSPTPTSATAPGCPQHGGGHIVITVTDLFCGAGGSGLGATAVAGVELRIAANHWALAIQTHATNVPDTDHVVESGCRPVADVFGFCRCWALR